MHVRTPQPRLRLVLAAAHDTADDEEPTAVRPTQEGRDARPSGETWDRDARPSDETSGPRFETRGSKDNREGRWTTWFDNGKKRSEGGYLDGEMHGPFTLWYESGSKREEGQYVRGRAHGRWVKWDEQGRKVKEVEFRHGVRISR